MIVALLLIGLLGVFIALGHTWTERIAIVFVFFVAIMTGFMR